METQYTETPVQLLQSRFNYHLQMMEHFEISSERCEHHDKMVTIYGRAIDILNKGEKKTEDRFEKYIQTIDPEFDIMEVL